MAHTHTHSDSYPPTAVAAAAVAATVPSQPAPGTPLHADTHSQSPLTLPPASIAMRIINNCSGGKHFALHFLQPKRKTTTATTTRQQQQQQRQAERRVLQNEEIFIGDSH